MVSSTLTILYHHTLFSLLNINYPITFLLDPGSLPRYRWDQLLILAWRTYLPLTLSAAFFITIIFSTMISSDTSLLQFSPFFISFKNKKFIKNKIILHLILLSILLYSILYFKTDIQRYLMILLYIYIGICSYYLLYTYRTLQKSFLSFLKYFANFIILTILILCTFTSFYAMKTSPDIYIENLSLTSGLRYLLNLIIIFTALILTFIFQKYLKNSNLFRQYLLEEITVILKSWESSFFGPLFYTLIHTLSKKKYVKIIFFSCHLYIQFYY